MGAFIFLCFKRHISSSHIIKATFFISGAVFFRIIVASTRQNVSKLRMALKLTTERYG